MPVCGCVLQSGPKGLSPARHRTLLDGTGCQVIKPNVEIAAHHCHDLEPTSHVFPPTKTCQNAAIVCPGNPRWDTPRRNMSRVPQSRPETDVAMTGRHSQEAQVLRPRGSCINNEANQLMIKKEANRSQVAHIVSYPRPARPPHTRRALRQGRW